MKQLLLTMSLFGVFSTHFISQSDTIDCNNVTYLEDTFYVSLNNNTISNTIFYNDSISMIYPSHCLILDDSLLIGVSYFTGVFNTGDDCHIFTHLTQNTTRDTLDCDYHVTFNSTNFLNNTIVNGNLVLSDVNSTCSNPIAIILQHGTVSSKVNITHRNRKLIKRIDFSGRETTSKPNIPFIEIYDDGTVDKKIVVE